MAKKKAYTDAMVQRMARQFGLPNWGVRHTVVALAIERVMCWEHKSHTETLARYARMYPELRTERSFATIAIKEAPKPAPAAVEVVKVAPAEDFLRTYEWRRVRMMVLKRDGARCACCGATPATGAVMNVDHIKPRKLFPSLALDPNNCQVLCDSCNHGKGNWDMTDWRPHGRSTVS